MVWGRNNTAGIQKIDSTFRGNVGAEVTAAMRTAGRTLAVIAAAIPAAGRTTQDGLCLVHGVPLLETEFASDPKTPIHSSRIAELVALQSDIPVHEVSLVDVRRGSLSALLSAFAKAGECMVVVDAVEERDLALIAQAVCEQKDAAARRGGRAGQCITGRNVYAREAGITGVGCGWLNE